MRYTDIQKAHFLSRINRFVARIEIDGCEELCHVKNTGRCQELFLPGTPIYVQLQRSTMRKTKYDLIAVQKGDTLINVDSQAPNYVVREWLENGGFIRGLEQMKPETFYRHSRFDFFLQARGKPAFLEVKGVTLEENGIAYFPDAPTERGLKHIRELCDCVKEGYDAYLIFVIQMQGCTHFHPNDRTQPEFGYALREAAGQGVQIQARECRIQPDAIEIDRELPVVFE